MDNTPCKPRYRVVLADHNRDYLRLVADYLGETGIFTVEEYAFDGREAYEITRRIKPDLLVLDLLHLEKTGQQTAQIQQRARLRALAPDLFADFMRSR